MIRFWVMTVMAGLVLTACGSSGGAGPSSSPASWRPRGVGPAVEVEIADRATVTVRVGELLHFAESDRLDTTVLPADLDRLTWYGDPRTFLALAPGRVTVDIPNNDRHIDCPNGPCAHPNVPLQMTVTITPGTAPHVPAPTSLPAGASAVRLAVGQRLVLPVGTHVAVAASGPECAMVAGAAIVGMRPGTQRFDLLTGRASRPLTVTVTP